MRWGMMQGALKFLKRRSETLLNLGAWNAGSLGAQAFTFRGGEHFRAMQHADADFPEFSGEIVEESLNQNSQSSADWSLELLGAKKKAFFVLGQKMLGTNGMNPAKASEARQGHEKRRSHEKRQGHEERQGSWATALINPDFHSLKAHYSANIQRTLECCQVVILPTPEKIVWQLLQGKQSRQDKQGKQSKEQGIKAWDWQSYVEDLCQVFAFLGQHKAAPQQNSLGQVFQRARIKVYCSDIVLLGLREYLFFNKRINGFSGSSRAEIMLIEELEAHFGFMKFHCVKTFVPSLPTLKIFSETSFKRQEQNFSWGRWHFSFALEPIRPRYWGKLGFLRAKVSGVLDRDVVAGEILAEFELGRKYCSNLLRSFTPPEALVSGSSPAEGRLVYEFCIGRRPLHFIYVYLLLVQSLFKALCFRVWRGCSRLFKEQCRFIGKKSYKWMAFLLQYLASQRFFRRIFPSKWDLTLDLSGDKSATRGAIEPRREMEASRVLRPVSSVFLHARSLYVEPKRVEKLASWSLPVFHPVTFAEREELPSPKALLDKETLSAAWVQERDCWLHLLRAAENGAALCPAVQKSFCLLLVREIESFLSQIEGRIVDFGLESEGLEADSWRRGFHAKEAAVRPLLRFRDAKHFWFDFFGHSRVMPFSTVLLWQLWSQLEPNFAKRLQKKRPIRSFLRSNSAEFERKMGQLGVYRELHVQDCLFYREDGGSLAGGVRKQRLARPQKMYGFAFLSFAWRKWRCIWNGRSTVQGAGEWHRLTVALERKAVIRCLGVKFRAFHFWPDWPEHLFAVAREATGLKETEEAEEAREFSLAVDGAVGGARVLSPKLFSRAKMLLSEQEQVFQRMAKLETLLQGFIQRNMRDMAFANTMLSFEARQQAQPALNVAASFVSSLPSLWATGSALSARAWQRGIMALRTSWANVLEVSILFGGLVKAGVWLVFVRGGLGGLVVLWKSLRHLWRVSGQVAASSYRTWQQFCDSLQRARLAYWNRRALWAERRRVLLQRARQRRQRLVAAQEAKHLLRVRRFRALRANVLRHFHLLRSRRQESNLARASLKHQRLYERSIAKLERQRAREIMLQKSRELKQQRFLQRQERWQLWGARWSERLLGMYRPVAKFSYEFSMFCKRNRKSVGMALSVAALAAVSVFVVPKEFYADTWAATRVTSSNTLVSLGSFGKSVGSVVGQGFRNVQVFVQGFSEVAKATVAKPKIQNDQGQSDNQGVAEENLLALQGSTDQAANQAQNAGQAEPVPQTSQGDAEVAAQAVPQIEPVSKRNEETASSTLGRARQILEDAPDFQASVTRKVESSEAEPEPIPEGIPPQAVQGATQAQASQSTTPNPTGEPVEKPVEEPSGPTQVPAVQAGVSQADDQAVQSSGNIAGNSFERVEMVDAPEGAAPLSPSRLNVQNGQNIPSPENGNLEEEGGFQPVPLAPRDGLNTENLSRDNSARADLEQAKPEGQELPNSQDFQAPATAAPQEGGLLEKPETAPPLLEQASPAQAPPEQAPPEQASPEQAQVPPKTSGVTAEPKPTTEEGQALPASESLLEE